MQVIDFQLGQTIETLVSEDLRRNLPKRPGAYNEPGVTVIGQPHTLRLKVGRQVIEVHPGGPNSVTYLQMGYRSSSNRIEQADYTRVGELNTDTGSRLLSSSEVRRLALDFCTKAADGLGAKADPDPAKALAEDTAKKLLTEGEGSVDICVVEGVDQTFVLRLSASAPSGLATLQDGNERFRLNIALGQTIA